MSKISDTQAASETVQTNRLNTPIATFLLGTPVLTAALLWLYVSHFGFAWSDLGIFLFMYFATGLSITAGYHRHYAHRSFDCPKWVEFLFLFFGAASVQNSLLNWASDHRFHHQYADRDGDPYNVNRGFWWAHIGWMFFCYPSNRLYRNSADLKSDRLVMFQHRYYVPVAIVSGFLFPAALGWCFGRPLGGFVWGGAIRMVVVHHVTFLINSWAHTFGKRTHAPDSSAADSPLLALFTFGEGYHSFHHAYAGDYRIGSRWYDIDFGKWLILTLHRLGLASKLRTTYRGKSRAA